VIKETPFIADKSGVPKVAVVDSRCSVMVNLEFFGDHVLGYCHFNVGIQSGGWKIILEF